MVKNIRKRDGRLEQFDVDKIAGALYKAFSACFDKVDLKNIYQIAKDVELKLEEQEISFPTVELVQDTVEEILIEKGYVRVAKAYILYRDKRSRFRDLKSILLDSIENNADNLNLYDILESVIIKTRQEDLNLFKEVLSDYQIDNQELLARLESMLDSE